MLKLVHLFDVPAAATVADRTPISKGAWREWQKLARSLASASRPCLDRSVLVALASRLFARV